MTDGHADVAAELWALANTVLTRLEPILQQAAVTQTERDRQSCSWCPVCATAALIRGEQHDLLTLVASEGAGVLALIRQLIADHVPAGARADDADPSAAPATSVNEDQAPEDVGTQQPAPHSAPSVANDTPGAAGRRASFVPITVVIKDSPKGDPSDR